MTRVALVTDSTSCLAAGSVAGLGPERDPALAIGEGIGEGIGQGIEVVPLVVIGDGEQRSDPELAALPDAELAAWFAGHKKVSTSRPSPALLLEAYEAAAAAGATAVVSAHLSGELSGTVESAILAASRASVPVTVIDSRTAGMALGHAVLSGARAAARGGTAAQVAAVVRARADDATVRLYVDRLDQLRRGGRIGPARHAVGSALAIRLVLTLEDGAIEPLARVRTVAKALDRIVADAVVDVEASPFGADVVVHDLAAGERADSIAARIAEACPQVAVERRPLGPVLGAHIGPGGLGVVVSPRPAPTSIAR